MTPSRLTVTALVESHLDERTDAVAFVDGGAVTTFGEFDLLVRRTASWLSGRGVGPGDLVAVWLVNRIEWLALFFALGRLGAALVSVNTRFRAAEVENILYLSGAKMLVLQQAFNGIDFPGILSEVDPARVPALETVAVVDAAPGWSGTLLSKPAAAFEGFSAEGPDVPDASSPEAAMMLFTTSGTTGGPKLVVHPQRTIVRHAGDCAASYGLDRAGARQLAVMPFCGAFGVVGILSAFAAGAPSFIVAAFDPAAAVQAIRRNEVTHIFASDEFYARILDLCPGPDPFPSARLFCFASFSPGAMDLAKAAWERRVPMLGAYGSSEVLGIFSVQSAESPLAERVMCGGVPASADVELRVRDVDSGAILPPGESGELEIRGPTLFREYLNNPAATAAASDGEGFFRTGDLGRTRPDGSFVFEVRRGDVIRLAGFMVDPTEIEDALKRKAGLAQAYVVAVEIEGKMRCVAFAIPRPGTAPSEPDLISVAKRNLAPFKVPARIWIVDEVPTTPSANGTKVQKTKLREMAQARLAAEAGS